jgi:hypothetical protein
LTDATSNVFCCALTEVRVATIATAMSAERI